VREPAQAVIIWRDELNDGKVFLRDIIDLEATYAGPDAKAVPAAVPGVGLRARRAPLKRGLSARLGEGVMNMSRGRRRIDLNVATISEMKDMP
jgi:hypothetical protein